MCLGQKAAEDTFSILLFSLLFILLLSRRLIVVVYFDLEKKLHRDDTIIIISIKLSNLNSHYNLKCLNIIKKIKTDT